MTGVSQIVYELNFFNEWITVVNAMPQKEPHISFILYGVKGKKYWMEWSKLVKYINKCFQYTYIYI